MKFYETGRLLEQYFDEVGVDGRYRKMGLKSWSLRNPATVALSVIGNVVNGFQSTEAKVRDKAAGTHHLIAVATKPKQELDYSKGIGQEGR